MNIEGGISTITYVRKKPNLMTIKHKLDYVQSYLRKDKQSLKHA